MIIFIAALQAVPEDLMSVRMEGAGVWALFRHITLPVLAPTVTMVGILTTVYYFQLFAEPYVMTQVRAAAKHLSCAVPDVRRGLPLVEPGRGLGRRLFAVPDHRWCDQGFDGAGAAP